MSKMKLLVSNDDGVNAEGLMSLADALTAVCKKHPIYGYRFEGIRYDCGSKLGFLKATVDFGLKHEELRDEFEEFLRGRVE